MSKKHYARIIYTNLYDDPGITAEKEFNTEDEAYAFLAGFRAARSICEASDEDPLEEYQAIYSDESIVADPPEEARK